MKASVEPLKKREMDYGFTCSEFAKAPIVLAANQSVEADRSMYGRKRQKT